MVSVYLHESWVACGDSIKKENNMGDSLCLYDQIFDILLTSAARELK